MRLYVHGIEFHAKLSIRQPPHELPVVRRRHRNSAAVDVNGLLCEPIMSDEGIYPTLFDTTIAVAGSSAWVRRSGGNFLLKRKPKAARPA